MFLDREEWRLRLQTAMWCAIILVMGFLSGGVYVQYRQADSRAMQAFELMRSDLDTSLTWIGMLEEWQTCFLREQPLRGCTNYLDSMVAATDRGAWYRLQRSEP